MTGYLAGNALLALSAAALWGGGDFSGGMGVKAAGGSMRAGLRIVLLSHAASFLVLLAIAHLRGDPFPRNPYLAWAFIEAAAFAIRNYDVANRYYHRKANKTNTILARKALAHKLARASFFVMRDQTPFVPQRLFG